jgi:sec-independent protein translocase protein TatB
MFNISWGEMLVLLMVALVVLGPERLPGAIRWSAGALRQARDYVSGATRNLREELGPEFDDLREPLTELQRLRGMNPRAVLTKHLLDGDDSLLTGVFENRSPAAPEPTAPAKSIEDGAESKPTPFDSDAT